MRSVRFLIVIAAAAGLFALANAAHAQQKMVLWEEFTQWNCPPCGASNPGIETMLGQNSQNVISVWYHGNFPDANDDPMYLWDQTDHQGRYNYYTVQSEPEARVDGVAIAPSGGYSGDPQDTAYDDQYLGSEAANTTPLTLNVTETPVGGQIKVHIEATSTTSLTSNYVLQVAVVKQSVDTPDAGSPYRNPERSFPNVVQKMLPDYNGTTISLNANQMQSYDLMYDASAIMPTGNASQVFVVAWVQNKVTGAIENVGTDIGHGFYFSAGAAAPSVLLDAPGNTTTFNASFKNSGSSSATIGTSLTGLNIPNTWHANYSVNGTSYTDTNTFSLAAGQTANFKVNFDMIGGKGIGSGRFIVSKINGDTITSTVYTYYSASSDVNTLIVDATGTTTRTSAYQSAISSISSTPHIAGILPSSMAPTFIPSDSSIKTTIYVVGSSEPTDAEFSTLTNYVQGGGNLLLTGETIYSQSDAAGQAFLLGQLHTVGVKTPLGNYEVSGFYGFNGVSGDPVSNNISSPNIVSVTQVRSDNTMWYVPDYIKPSDNQATTIFKYNVTGDTSCGVRVQPTFYNFKAVYLAFGLEAMSDVQQRNQLMKNILAWFDAATPVKQSTGISASDFSVMQNYPNPFGGTTNIQFTLPEAEHVTLNVYDMQGSLVASLANGMLQAGSNSIPFDGTNLPAGVYEYRLTTPAGTMSHLMSLVK